MYPFYPPPLWGTDRQAWVRDTENDPLANFVWALAPASRKLLRKVVRSIGQRIAGSPIPPATQPCCS